MLFIFTFQSEPSFSPYFQPHYSSTINPSTTHESCSTSIQHGYTPLHHAVDKSHCAIAELLIKRGARVNVVAKVNIDDVSRNGHSYHLACYQIQYLSSTAICVRIYASVLPALHLMLTLYCISCIENSTSRISVMSVRLVQQPGRIYLTQQKSATFMC